MKKAWIKALACFSVFASGDFWGISASAQDMTAPLDDATLFGGPNDLVTVIDTATASAGTIELVKDTKTYPVFLLEGDASAGMRGAVTAYGTATTGTPNLFGAINLGSLSFDFLPSRNLNFNITTDATLLPTEVKDLSVSAYADLRASEFTRFYAAGSYNYNISSSANSLVTVQDGFSLDEIFVDTAIDRKLFFRLGKQRVSWGVGNWYKPADVLSLSQIDPDNPTASREGPFAFKTDMPFGTLNHATLYMVPPIDGDPSKFSIAERTDLVVGGFELSFAGFARTDMQAKPRLMFMFSGAIGPFDVYGENVAAWGSDRTYVRDKAGGGYETYAIENQPVFQSTLGIKYSWENSDGLSADFHVQGYYNGTGYRDSSILQIAAARSAIINGGTYTSNDLIQAGMYYLAGSVSFGARFGEGTTLTNTSLGSTALVNFSDMSMRFKPAWSLTIGSGGSMLKLNLSALTSIGNLKSEYAPSGNMITPDLSMTILKSAVASVSTPLKFNQDFSLNKASVNFSLYWNVVSFQN